jgi:hypothetical protein
MSHTRKFHINGRGFAVQIVNQKGVVKMVHTKLEEALELYPEEASLGAKKYYRHSASKN